MNSRSDIVGHWLLLVARPSLVSTRQQRARDHEKIDAFSFEHSRIARSPPAFPKQSFNRLLKACSECQLLPLLKNKFRQGATYLPALLIRQEVKSTVLHSAKSLAFENEELRHDSASHFGACNSIIKTNFFKAPRAHVSDNIFAQNARLLGAGFVSLLHAYYCPLPTA